MSNNSLEARIIAAKPENDLNQSPFTQKVMREVSKQSAETFTQIIRRTGVAHKQRRIIVKLRTANKSALIALALLGALVISGSAYAAYKLWLSPDVRLQNSSTDSYKRRQLLFSTKNCETNPNSNEKKFQYELKSGSTLSETDATKVMQAKCEMGQINKWAYSKWKMNDLSTMLSTDLVYEVTNISDKIAMVSTYSGITSNTESAPISDKTLWIEDGMEISKSSVAPKDTVYPIQKYTYKDERGGSPIRQELLAVIKLSLPEKYYSPDLQNQLTERSTCVGNTAESCLAGGASLDVFPLGNEGTTNTGLRTDTPLEYYTIEGMLSSHHPTSFTIVSRSGKTYTIHSSGDILEKFNSTKKSVYGKGVAIGDTLSVSYYQKHDQDHAAIMQNDITRIILLLELDQKNSPLQKY